MSLDSVSLRACNTCDTFDETDDVTIVVEVYWNNVLLASQSRTGNPRAGHCTPMSSVELTLP